jgi:hypothetical protein
MFHCQFGEDRSHGRNADVTVSLVAAAASAVNQETKAFSINASTSIHDRVICGANNEYAVRHATDGKNLQPV